ncbi:hypothetical protein EW146_g2645 [Bondarzewia mesenterica]|uniref:Uncharacterized protein n=1 Tax=Bondarzewia mesenterica TaxID=1095465 RepID=A0A4S4M686_9AGAM|nr:hypothetical protein EW146_g2645 [Bondarzewia mesenterica]
MSSPTSAPLTEWAQSRLKAIYSAPDEVSLNSAVDSFFSPNIIMMSNDKKVTRDEAREEIAQQLRVAQRADVNYESMNEMSSGKGEGLISEQASAIGDFPRH